MSNRFVWSDDDIKTQKPKKKKAVGESLINSSRTIVAEHGSHNQSSHGNWARGRKSGRKMSASEYLETRKGKMTATRDDGFLPLADMYNKVGLHGKPQVVSTENFDKESEGKQVVYRGVKDTSDNQYKRDFMYGEKHYAGSGLYGDGTYTSPKASRARAFSNEDSVMRMYIKKSARGISLADARNGASELKKELPRYSVDEIRLMEGEAKQNAYSENFVNSTTDSSMYAISQGFDYVTVDDANVVILNREAVVVDENYQEVKLETQR